MKIREGMSWILFRPDEERRIKQETLPREEYLSWYWQYDDETTRIKKDFVHSLGLKCDAVGWSYLDLNEPNAEELLSKIDAFCKAENFLVRAGYSRWFQELESDWYEVELRGYTGGTKVPVFDIWNCPPSRQIYTTKAYENKEAPIVLGDRHYPMVSETFREACLRHGIPDVEFCWIRDTGRYASSQYFFLYPQHTVPKFALVPREMDYNLDWKEYERPFTEEIRRCYEQLGGWLPRLSRSVHEMHAALPICYPAAEMPATGFACAALEPPAWVWETLIHKDTAKLLIEEKLLPPGCLRPVLLYDQVPEGYVEKESIAFTQPERELRDVLLAEYEQFKKTDKRPARKVTEKEALRQLRLAKYQRKEEFAKGMKRAFAPSLEGTAWEPLKPYFLIANGGALSDEYELLSYKKALEATRKFAEDMAQEELLEEIPEGVAFVACADGDKVVLRPDGTAARFSHEEPAAIEDWPSLAQFFVDCTETE